VAGVEKPPDHRGTDEPRCSCDKSPHVAPWGPPPCARPKGRLPPSPPCMANPVGICSNGSIEAFIDAGTGSRRTLRQDFPPARGADAGTAGSSPKPRHRTSKKLYTHFARKSVFISPGSCFPQDAGHLARGVGILKRRSRMEEGLSPGVEPDSELPFRKHRVIVWKFHVPTDMSRWRIWRETPFVRS
jgi:hypothetical protein